MRRGLETDRERIHFGDRKSHGARYFCSRSRPLALCAEHADRSRLEIPLGPRDLSQRGCTLRISGAEQRKHSVQRGLLRLSALEVSVSAHGRYGRACSVFRHLPCRGLQPQARRQRARARARESCAALTPGLQGHGSSEGDRPRCCLAFIRPGGMVDGPVGRQRRPRSRCYLCCGGFMPARTSEIKLRVEVESDEG